MGPEGTSAGARRILLLSARSVTRTTGGIQCLIRQWETALLSAGHTVVLASADQCGGFGQGNKRVLGPGVPGRLLDPRPDLVHFVGSTCIFMVQVARACRRRGIPYVWTPCFHPFWSRRHPRAAAIYFQWVERPQLNRATRAFMLSSRESEFFSRHCPALDRVLIPLSSGVPERGQRRGIDSSTQAGTKEGQDRRYLLFVGRRAPNKGFDYLSDLDDWLAEQGIELYAVTQARPGETFRSIHFMPAVGEAELNALYAGAVACVVPSRYESFSLVTVEALAHGTPVLVSDQVAVGEYLEESSACTILPLNDRFPEALREAIRSIWRASEEQRATWSNAARRAAREFAPERVLTIMIDEAERVLEPTRLLPTAHSSREPQVDPPLDCKKRCRQTPRKVRY